MISAIRTIVRLGEAAVASFRRGLRALITGFEMLINLPNGLGLIVLPTLAYIVFDLILVYVYAPIRGFAGQIWAADALSYASERWLATAIYDAKDRFVGTFDLRMDSKRDVNFTGEPIRLSQDQYVANPDHKSIPLRQVPEPYWRCLKYHEDRHLGSYTNPFGIDLWGVLRIPYSSLTRSIES